MSGWAVTVGIALTALPTMAVMMWTAWRSRSRISTEDMWEVLNDLMEDERARQETVEFAISDFYRDYDLFQECGVMPGEGDEDAWGVR